MRAAVFAGYAGSVVYYFVRVRWRLPFAERAAHPLHHHLIPSAAYSSVAGGVGGGLYGYYYEQSHFFVNTPEQQRKRQQTLERQEATARREQLQYRSAVLDHTRRRVEAAEMGAMDRLWWRFVSPARYERSVEERVTALLGSEAVAKGKDWQRFVPPYSLLWVRLHSSSRDASPSKERDDLLVSRVLSRYHDKEEHRWTRTGSRLGLYGGLAGLLLWNSGGMLFRLALGVGNGVAIGAVVSSLRLEETFKYV
ncbi:hypothetical protein AGDE_02497 [Angomonas deanei]|nr:hypothetical protein AGDE_02497 [Angomonas deanei]|eukprot:EPY41427.1 hypothetical protein AGDE_02497 [Angomonas deanei]